MKIRKKYTALFSLIGLSSLMVGCSGSDFRAEFYKDRPCPDIKYQCLSQHQENTMLDTSKPYVITNEELARHQQSEKRQMYREIAQMLEIYYPGFWEGVSNEQVKLDWVEKADEIAIRYYDHDRLRGTLEIMASVCAIIGLDFEQNPKFDFIVKRLKSHKSYSPLIGLHDYLRFEILQKDFDDKGIQYNTWSLRGASEGMPPYTRHVPNFDDKNEWLPDNENENVWRIYKKTVRYGGKK